MHKGKRYVMLSFDTEEFDVPREHGADISLEDAVHVSNMGVNKVLDLLEQEKVKATFFCTTNFALNMPETIVRILQNGHELASHGCDHTFPIREHWKESKQQLEQRFGVTVNGYRQPRMFEVDDKELRAIGYLYNSSINPAFIPGRYMNLKVKRTVFEKDGLLQIPTSVTPLFRIPLFWLSLHHFPLWLYKCMALHTLNSDGYFNTYFHPWEFYPISQYSQYNIPFFIGKRTGDAMLFRLKCLIDSFLRQEAEFVTYSDFIHSRYEKD